MKHRGQIGFVPIGMANIGIADGAFNLLKTSLEQITKYDFESYVNNNLVMLGGRRPSDS